jgi:uncharacterized protein YxeA
LERFGDTCHHSTGLRMKNIEVFNRNGTSAQVRFTANVQQKKAA